MRKETIENQFSQDIEAYLRGEENHSSEPQVYKELLTLGKALADRDFSQSTDKNTVYQKTLKKIRENKESGNMKKRKFKKTTLTAAALALLFVGTVTLNLTQPSFAQDLVHKVIKTLTAGRISAVQVEPQQWETIALPAGLQGKAFDKDGNPIEKITKEMAEAGEKLYTAEGKEIVGFNGEKIMTVDEGKENRLIVTEPDKLNNYTCFEVILPSYLPEGYSFDKAEFFKDEKGEVSSKYISLYFTNGEPDKYLYMQQRFADEETAYEIGTDGKIEQIKINGFDGILSDGRSIDWEANDVLYNLSGRGHITKDELIKMAESIK
ncbi:MAG: DUF4367 domain-containing protein [Thermotaleaceae bacterium]